MYVFIDEAGTFQVPTATHKVSCIAALVVPEPFAATLFRKFRKTIAPWRGNASEIKGSHLDERQVATVVKLLRRFDVLVFAACVDAGVHTAAMVEAHKQGQAESFLRAIRAEISPELNAHVRSLADRTRALSNQLYVQWLVLQEVVAETFRWSTLYYVQRIPKTLSAFKWRIDAKGRSITTYEQLWMDAVTGLLQTRSFEQPLITMQGADYSAFKKFQRVLPETPRHLKHLIENPSDPFPCVDIEKILKSDLRFSGSHRYSGLQLADIVATSIRRACNGTLQRSGWRDIGKLMLQRGKGERTGRNEYALRLMSLAELPRSAGKELPYRDVVETFDLDAKRMITSGTFAAAEKERSGL